MFLDRGKFESFQRNPVDNLRSSVLKSTLFNLKIMFSFGESESTNSALSCFVALQVLARETSLSRDAQGDS